MSAEQEDLTPSIVDVETLQERFEEFVDRASEGKRDPDYEGRQIDSEAGADDDAS